MLAVDANQHRRFVRADKRLLRRHVPQVFLIGVQIDGNRAQNAD
jgi:hypothetical protein